MVNKKDNMLKELGTIFLIILIIGSIFEIGILIFAYVNADKVECNFLWCTFTIGDITESHKTISQTSTSECFLNGKEINCSESKYYNKLLNEFANEWANEKQYI